MTTTPSSDLRLYELMVLLSGDLTESDFERELNEIRKTLKENAKAVTYEDIWGRRELTYRMKRQSNAYYAIFDFNAAPDSLIELRTSMKLNPHVLRHLLIALPENYEFGKYKTMVLPEEKPVADEKKHRIVKRVVPAELERAPIAAPAGAVEEAKKPLVAGKEEEEKLKKVEKKLEEILENPDIEIR